MIFLYFLPLLFLKLGAATTSSNSGYMLTVPNLIGFGNSSSVCIDLYDVKSSVKVDLVLQYTDSNGKRVATENSSFTVLPSEKTKCSALYYPNHEAVNKGDRSMQIKASGSGGIVFVETLNMSMSQRYNFVAVQPDKMIYKPGQLVRFRVIIHDLEQKKLNGSRASLYIERKWMNLLAHTGNAQINTSGVVIRKWTNLLLHNGISHHTFQLTNVSEQGMYTIVLEHDGNNHSASFQVLNNDVKLEYPFHSIITIEGPNSISSGLPYTGVVKVRTLHNTPFKGEPVNVSTPYFSKVYISDEDGLIKFSHPAVNDDFTIQAWTSKARMNEDYPSRLRLERTYSPSGSYLQILPLTTPVLCSSFQTFTIMHTNNNSFQTQLYYKVVSGDLIDSGSILVKLQANTIAVSDECLRWDKTAEQNTPGQKNTTGSTPYPTATSKGVIKVDIKLNEKMSSTAFLHVYYVAASNEVVADSIKFYI